MTKEEFNKILEIIEDTKPNISDYDSADLLKSISAHEEAEKQITSDCEILEELKENIRHYFEKNLEH